MPHALSPKKYPDPDCPPHFYAHGHNPQYRAFGSLMGYMNRVCSLISDGKAFVNTAILYHAEAEWAGDHMQDQKVTRALMEHQIACHVIPQDVFTQRERYHTKFSEEYITSELSKAVKEMSDTGCKVISVGGRPKAVFGCRKLPEHIARSESIPLHRVPDMVQTLAFR